MIMVYMFLNVFRAARAAPSVDVNKFDGLTSSFGVHHSLQILLQGSSGAWTPNLF